MNKYLIISILLFFVIPIKSGLAQEYNPLQKPNTFRSSDNPYYWKNRKPYDGYWQQDVHYKIKATLDEKTDILYGEEELTYWNNSPHSLPFVYFHLYQNAFQPDSYYDRLAAETSRKLKFGKYGNQQLGTVVESITVNNINLKTELDNTILKVYLQEPLKSGDSISFKIKFKTHFEIKGNWRRMSLFNVHSFKHYNGVHWYPRITVYDRKFGWTTDQHFGKEFYGDFGTYDIELTLANNFILDGTGYLVNRKEVLPDDLRKKLDISNFKYKPWGETPSVIIPYDSTKTKTWIFHAENVHDFAFTADPTYRIGEVEWNGIKAIALVQEPHAVGWQNAAEIAMKIIKMFSESIGPYAYHKIIVADARQGMEYPMLTLDGGMDPYYKYVFVHEIGHNWFFGQVGSNETYRAVLDEGFTQFLTVWALDKFIEQGEALAFPEPSKYIDKHKKKFSCVYKYAYLPYLKKAIRNEDLPLNTHSDVFESWQQYRQVYYKGSTMLYNLQYVLGDSLFNKAMQYYFDKWKFCHPYLPDFRNAFIEYTQVDLNWFFDQWLETSKHIDYAVKSVKKLSKEDDYIITFERKGEMQMPVDFQVSAKDGKKYQFHIPNTWFVKQSQAKVLPKWFGWNKLQPTYKAEINIPSGIKNVQIAPSYRLADINLLNNSKKFPVRLYLDSKVNNRPDWKNYEIYTRPALWYNGYDGLKAGVHFNGNYMNYKHIFDFTFWLSSRLFSNESEYINKNALASFDFNYQTAIGKLSKNTTLILSLKSLDGLEGGTLGIDKKFGSGKNNFYAHIKSMHRRDSTSLVYLLYPDDWETDKFNNTINLGYNQRYSYRKGNGNINIHLKSSTIGSDYDYSTLSLTSINHTNIWKLRLNTRAFIQYGTGDYFAGESSLYLAGANSEELMENKYTRSIGFFDNNWIGFSETTQGFHSGGGLNLRGYAGYLVVEETENNEYIFIYKGHTGAAINLELEFDKLINPLLRFCRKTLSLNTYLFGDAGIINTNPIDEKLQFSNLRADAGIGAALTIKKWGSLQKIKPLTIRFDAPVFLNRPPAVEEFFQFRWIVSVNRAF